MSVHVGEAPPGWRLEEREVNGMKITVPVPDAPAAESVPSAVNAAVDALAVALVRVQAAGLDAETAVGLAARRMQQAQEAVQELGEVERAFIVLTLEQASGNAS